MIQIFCMLLLLRNMPQCTAGETERLRQVQITALLHNYHTTAKKRASSKKLLQRPTEESEQKTPPASQDCTLIFACASDQQRKDNERYKHKVLKRLEAANIPTNVIHIIQAYAQPEWVLHTIVKHHTSRIYNMVVTDRSLPAFSYETAGSTAASWNADTGSLIKLFPHSIELKPKPEEFQSDAGFTKSYTDYAYSPNQRLIACTTFDKGNLYVWPRGKTLTEAIKSETCLNFKNKRVGSKYVPLTSVVFSPDSRHISVGGADGTISLIDRQSGALLYTCPDIEHAAVTALDYSSDGATLYAGLEDGRIALWKGSPVSESTPPLAAHTSSNSSDDTPEAMTMLDNKSRSRVIHVDDDADYRQELKNFACCIDCLKCCELCGDCGASCAKMTKLSVACCCTAASCIGHCPRTCGYICYRGCARCAQKTCVTFCRRLLGSIFRR